MDKVKIYGLCLERLKHQIALAKKRLEGKERGSGYFLIESYNTGITDDIVDILELYDLENKTPEQLKEKLDDLAYTVSVLLGHTLVFDYTVMGHLGLYLALQSKTNGLSEEELGVDVAAASFA